MASAAPLRIDPPRAAPADGEPAAPRWRGALAALAALPWAEIATGAAFVAGWLLVTWGVASLTAWEAWPISIGLLLISSGGWKLLRRFATDGLYDLMGERKDGRP